MLDIGDRAHVDLSFNNVDIESAALGDKGIYTDRYIDREGVKGG